MAATREKTAFEHDVFVCRADPRAQEPCSTLVAYLERAGFRVLFEAAGEERPQAERLALAKTITDFVLFLPSPAFGGLEGGTWRAEVAAALATGRNVVRVAMAGEPAWAGDTLPPGLETQQVVQYDPDRLAESLSLLQHCLSSDTIVNDRHLMRRTKRWFLFAALLVAAGFAAQTVPILIKAWNRPRPLPPVAPFALYWAGFAERQVAGVVEEITLEEGAGVRGGDRLRVAFSPSADGFAYVIAKDARGRVSVLFPTDSVKRASRVQAGRTYHAPVDSGWLTVDPEAGVDTIYIFASYDPLQNLEELIEEPEATPNDAGSRRALVDQTVNGLLDGRHHPGGQRVWIRSTAVIDQGLKPGRGPAAFSAALANGRTVSHPATTESGLVNALAEVKLRFSRQ